MDFQSLSRRDLQSLCKKNKIPANLTNAAMADALQSLPSVEGLAEIKETLQFQSPKKPDLLSPAVPRTGRRATASRTKAVVDEEEKEYDVPKERQGSPLPRSRRVTARASEILSMVDAADDGVEKGPSKKEVPQTPKVPTTRRKAADAPTVQKTVATRRRAADGKEVENAAVGVTTGRRTRQLSKKEVSQVLAVGDDLMSGGLKRSTRGRGRSAAVSKMTSLSKEEEEEDQKKEAEVSVKQNNHEEEVSVNKEEEKEITEELGSKDQDCESDQVLEDGCGDETFQDEKQEKSLQESSPSAEEASENNQDQEGCGLLSGLDDSPIRGLITSDQATNDEQQQNLLTEEIENAERSSEQEEAIATVDGELNPAETGDSGGQSPDLVACDQTDITGQPLAAESKESGEGNGEKDTGGNEITAEATEIELTVESPAIESPAKHPQEDNVTGAGNGEVDTGRDHLSFSPANREITAEAAELDLTVESPAIESPEKQPHEDDGNGEVDTGGEDLSFSPANGEIVEEATELELAVDSPAKQPTEGDATGEGNGGADAVCDGPSFSPASGEIAEEATEPDLTVESPTIDSPAKQPNEDDVTGEGDDLSFSPLNGEIAAEAAEPDLTVEAPAIESPAKQPMEDDVTGEGDDLSFSPENGEIAAEAAEPYLTVEAPAIESPAKQPKEDDVTGEGDDLSFSPENGEIAAEAAEPDLTVEAPAIESPAKQPKEDDVTGECDDLSFSPANGEIAAEATEPELTVESPATESSAKLPKEDDVILDLGPDDDVAVDIAVQIPVEVDKSGADLSGDHVLAGEIAVEAIGEEKQPSLQADIGGEYMDEVLVELMDDLSDLKLSAGSELPFAGIHRERKGSDDKENGRLTESNAGANGEVVGPIGMKKYEEMSLRKLKAAYKETLLSKGGEKRAALKAIDVNKDGAANIF